MPIASIIRERIRQEHLRASGKFPWTCADPTVLEAAKLAVLAEEFGEVAREVTEALIDKTRRDPAKLRAELIQVAAVCVAWCEAIDAEAAGALDAEGGEK